MQPRHEQLIELWSELFRMEGRPALWVGSASVERLRPRIDALCEGFALAHPDGPRFLKALRDARSRARNSVDSEFDLVERVVARFLKRKLVRRWPASRQSPDLQGIPRNCLFLDGFMGYVWGRQYDRPLDPRDALHQAVLQRTARVLKIPPETRRNRAPEREPALWILEVCGLEPPRALSLAEVAGLPREPRLLAGAALGMEISAEQSETLVQAALLAPRDPVIWGSLSCFLLALETTWEPDPLQALLGTSLPGEMRVALVSYLARLDAGNGAVDLLKAYQFLRGGFLRQAEQALVRAAGRARLELWDRTLWPDIVRAAEMAGWSRVKARELPFGLGQITTVILRLKPLVDRVASPSGRRAVDTLAHRLEALPLIIDQMMGLSWQKPTRRTRRVRRETGAELHWLHRVLPEQLSEERWADYLDQVIRDSERAAIRALQAEGIVPLGTE